MEKEEAGKFAVVIETPSSTDDAVEAFVELSTMGVPSEDVNDRGDFAWKDILIA